MVELIAELDGSKSMKEFEEKVKAVKEYFDWIDIPDSPLGHPGPFSLIASCIIEERYRVKTIPHIRVIDLNETALKSIAKTLPLTRIKRIVLLRGDPPRRGSRIEDLSPDEAMEVFKKRNPGLEVGLLISMNYPWRSIEDRLDRGPEFILVLNHMAKGMQGLVTLAEKAYRRGIMVIPYIVLSTPRNQDVISRLNRSSIIEYNAVGNHVSKLRGMVDGLLLSSPGDYKVLVDAAILVQDLINRR